MNNTFHSKAASAHFYSCLCALCVLLGILLVNQLTKNNTYPKDPVTVTLEKPATLHARINDEDVEVKVKAGREIRILAARSGDMLTPERLLVELEDGTRGMIYCLDFDLEYKAQLKDTKGLKPVRVKGIAENEKMICELEDGTTKELYCDDVYPVWPEEWKVSYISAGSYNSYISKKGFEKKFIGSTFEENDDRLRPARFVVRQNGVLYATYPFWIVDTSTGERITPTVEYGQDGIAVSYKEESSMKRAKFLTRIWPFLGVIMDSPMGSSLIEGSMYEFLPSAKGDPSLVMKILGFVVMIIYLVFVLLWLYATPMIPVLLLGILLHFPKLFRPLNNKTLSAVFLIVALVSVYCWTALLLAWGIMWLFLIPLPFVAIAFYTYVCSPLFTEAPSGRCIGCRAMEAMYFVDSVFDHEYQKWMRETEYVKLISEKKRKYKTWTQVTTTYADGHTSTSNENVQNHTQTIRTSLYDDYKVLYKVKVYKNNYECAACGQHEHNFSEKYFELDRVYMGTHQETTVEDY